MVTVSLDERLTEVFREVFDDDELEIVDATTADDIEDWDSLQHINLLFAVEPEFGVEFSGVEGGKLADVGARKALLRDKGADLAPVLPSRMSTSRGFTTAERRLGQSSSRLTPASISRSAACRTTSSGRPLRSAMSRRPWSPSPSAITHT